MILSRLFLLVIAITVFLTALQLSGYQVIGSLMVMVVIDFMTLGAMFHMERGAALIKNNPISVEKDIVPRLQKIDKIEEIEKTCSEIKESVSNSENALKKQGDSITYLLDRMTKKTMDLEQRINKFGNGLIDSISDFKNNVNGNGEKKNGESFSIGELVYVKEDKQDS